MSPADIAAVVGAGACWGVTAHKLVHLRRRQRDPLNGAVASLMVVTFCVGTSWILTAPFVRRHLDRHALPTLSGFIVCCLELAACLALMAWLLHLSRPTEEARAWINRWCWVYAGVVMIMLYLYVLDHSATDTYRNVGAPVYPYSLAIAVTVVFMLIAALRYARVCHSPLLRLGLRLIAATSAVSVAIAIMMFIETANRDFHLQIANLDTAINR
jgi:hypothetical protein